MLPLRGFVYGLQIKVPLGVKKGVILAEFPLRPSLFSSVKSFLMFSEGEKGAHFQFQDI